MRVCLFPSLKSPRWDEHVVSAMSPSNLESRLSKGALSSLVGVSPSAEIARTVAQAERRTG